LFLNRERWIAIYSIAKWLTRLRITSSCLILFPQFFCKSLASKIYEKITWLKRGFIERYTINVPKDFCRDKSIRACAPSECISCYGTRRFKEHDYASFCFTQQTLYIYSYLKKDRIVAHTNMIKYTFLYTIRFFIE